MPVKSSIIDFEYSARTLTSAHGFPLVSIRAPEVLVTASNVAEKLAVKMIRLPIDFIAHTHIARLHAAYYDTITGKSKDRSH